MSVAEVPKASVQMPSPRQPALRVAIAGNHVVDAVRVAIPPDFGHKEDLGGGSDFGEAFPTRRIRVGVARADGRPSRGKPIVGGVTEGEDANAIVGRHPLKSTRPIVSEQNEFVRTAPIARALGEVWAFAVTGTKPDLKVADVRLP